MDYLKKEIIALLAVIVTLTIVGIDLFASEGPSSRFLKSGAKVISPVGASSSARCETPFRTIKVEPKIDAEPDQIQLKIIAQ